MGRKLSDIIDRLKKLYEFKTDADVASALGLSRAKLSHFKTSDTIPYEALMEFSKNEKLSLDWLLTGEEPFMLFNYWRGTDEGGERLYATNKGFMPQSEVENLLGISPGTLEEWFNRQIAVIKLPESVESDYATEKAHNILKKVVMSVEEYLVNEGFLLDPKKKAELITILFEDLINNKMQEKDLSKHAARLANLAS